MSRIGKICNFQPKSCSISNRTLVTVTDQQEVPYALSIGNKIIDLGWPWMVDTHLIAEKIIFCSPVQKFQWRFTHMSAVRWATNRSEAAKIDIFYRMQRRFSDILSCSLMTQRQVTLIVICGYFMLEKFLGHICGWLAGCIGWALDSWSTGRWFNSRPGRYQVN